MLFILCVSGDLGQTFDSISTLQHYMQGEGKVVLFVGDLTYADQYYYYDKSMFGPRWDTWGRFVEQRTTYQPRIWTTENHDIDYFPFLVIFNYFSAMLI